MMDGFYSDNEIEEVDNYVPEESGRVGKVTSMDYNNMVDYTNFSIRRFLHEMRVGSDNDDIINRDATRNTQDFLDTTISRTITINVPLIPAYTDLRTLLYEITENGVKHFLIRKHKYIELITSQSVFEYVANAYDPDDTIMDNIRRQRIPFKPRTMTIRDAFNFMIEKNIPLILIDWTDEEKKKYAHIQKFVYPNVVTLSQIYTMICQRLIDDELLPSSVDVHGHENYEEDEDTEMIQLRFQHRSMYDEEPQRRRRRRRRKRSVEQNNAERRNEDNEDNEGNNRLSERCRECFMKSCNNTGEFLNKVLIHWLYRTILILFVAYDMLLCLFYIIDYNNYAASKSYFTNGIIMIIDCILRYILVSKQFHWLRDSFELLSLFVSSGLYFVALFVSPSREYFALVKTFIVFRLLRSYIFFVNEKTYISKTTRKWFNRHRSQKEEENIDMSDITKRIIAMSWPGNNFESVWRNNIDDVEKYLNSCHMGHYWVLNLCAEGSYSKSAISCFGGRNTHYFIEDHNACSLKQIQAIVNHSNNWLLQDPANVIAIHCKGGKGRTGMIISCLLLKQGIKDSPIEALNLFAQRRTCSSNDKETSNTKMQRVSSPSQIRYVFYYNFLLTHELKPKPFLHLSSIEIPISNNYWDELFLSLKFEVSIQSKVFQEGNNDIDSLAHATILEKTEHILDYTEMSVIPSRQVARIDFERPIALIDDIKLTIQCTGSITDVSSFIWFNTHFITRKDTLFLDDEIDSHGQKMKTRLRRSSTAHSIQSDTSSKHYMNSIGSSNRILSGIRNSSDDEESDSSKNYGTFMGMSPNEELPMNNKSLGASDSFYIRLQFVDDFLSSARDPDAQVIRKDEYLGNNSKKEMKKTLRALGETRKKAKDLVVGSTHFIVNTTEKIGNTFISLVNGETWESPTTTINGSPSNSSSALLSKPKRKYEPRHIPIVQEEVDSEVVVPEIRRNIDESD